MTNKIMNENELLEEYQLAITQYSKIRIKAGNYFVDKAKKQIFQDDVFGAIDTMMKCPNTDAQLVIANIINNLPPKLFMP